jgi:hypothetical protein
LLVDEIPASNFLTNSTIQFISGHGIDAAWAASAINTPDIAAGNTFSSLAGCKQTFNAKSGGTCPSFGCTE